MSVTLFSHSGNSPGSFYVSGGTLGHDAPCYVTRRADDDLYVSLKSGVFCYVLTARQMGKSSLMVRTAARLRQEGSTTLVLDLTAIGQNVTVEQWYRGVLGAIGEQLNREDLLAGLWREQSDRSPVQRWTKAICKVVLDRQPANIVIFVDEVDTVLNLPFSVDEFFAAIRELHNRRAECPDLGRLAFCLLGVASPSDLIRDPRTTPFNIGRRIELSDFTEAEAASLTRGLQRPETLETTLLRRILYWTGGHPYLTQRLCQAVAAEPAVSGSADVDRMCQTLFFSHRARERDDNLVFVRERLLRSEVDLAGLLGLYATVLRGSRVRDDESNQLISILRLSGIARGKNGHLAVRNRIYSHVFDHRWVAESMPGAELRRQRAAYRRGLLRAAAVAALIIAVMAVLALIAINQRNRAEQEALHNRRLLYREHIHLAQQEWETGALSRIEELLESHRPKPGQEDLRGFEWYYLWRLCHSDALTLRHPNAVRVCVPSPDDKTIATAGDDHTARLWDLATGRVLATFKGLADRIPGVGFFNDGSRLLTGSADGTAKLWDLATGQELLTLRGHTGTVRWTLCPDQRSVITGGYDGTLRQWDLATGKGVVIFRLQTGEFLAILHNRLAVASDEQTVKVWEVATGRMLTTLQGHAHAPLVFSSDASRVVAVTKSGGNTIKIWEVSTGNQLTTFEVNTSRCNTLAISSDGKLVVVGGSDGTVHLSEVATGQELATFKGHTDEINSVTFLRGDKRVVSVSNDHTLKLWDVATRQGPTTLRGHAEAVYSVAFSPDGQKVATASADHTVRLWEAGTGRGLIVLEGHSGPVWSVRFSPDGSRLASGGNDRTVRLWEAATGKALLTLTGHTGGVFPLSFSPDGKKLITGSDDRTARLWDVTTGQELATLTGHASAVWAVAFSPDGRTLATGSEDQMVKLWEAATGRELITLSGHGANVFAVAFSPDGKRLASGSKDRTVKVWEVATGRELTTLKGHGDMVYSVAFSPDGKRVVAGSSNWTVKLWEVETGQELATLKGHTGQVWAVAFSPDGRTLATASGDCTVKLWQAATDQEVWARDRNERR